MCNLSRISNKLRNPGVNYIFKDSDCYPSFDSLSQGKDFFTITAWAKMNALTTPLIEESLISDFIGMAQSGKRSIFSKINRKEYLDYIKRESSIEKTKELEMKFSESERKRIKRQESQKIFDDDSTLAICPLSYESSIIYGYGTKWCTSSNSTRKYYDNYSSKAKIIIIINNKEPSPYRKIALILFKNNKFCLFDSQGCIINDGEVFNEHEETYKSNSLTEVAHILSDQLIQTLENL